MVMSRGQRKDREWFESIEVMCKEHERFMRKSRANKKRHLHKVRSERNRYTGFATVADAAQSGCVGRWENKED